jgi:hypothetical protein
MMLPPRMRLKFPGWVSRVSSFWSSTRICLGSNAEEELLTLTTPGSLVIQLKSSRLAVSLPSQFQTAGWVSFMQMKALILMG